MKELTLKTTIEPDWLVTDENFHRLRAYHEHVPERSFSLVKELRGFIWLGRCSTPAEKVVLHGAPIKLFSFYHTTVEAAVIAALQMEHVTVFYDGDKVELHKCRYCGQMVETPDEFCHKAPKPSDPAPAKQPVPASTIKTDGIKYPLPAKKGDGISKNLES